MVEFPLPLLRDVVTDVTKPCHALLSNHSQQAAGVRDCSLEVRTAIIGVCFRGGGTEAFVPNNFNGGNAP